MVNMGNDAEISDVLHRQFVTNNFAQRYCIFKGKKERKIQVIFSHVPSSAVEKSEDGLV